MAVWIGALAFLALDSGVKLRSFDAVAAFAEAARPPPPRDAHSPTGYAAGQRNEILDPGDSYHWVMQTQTIAAGEGLRTRTVNYDNAPFGREVHWSSPLRWWLATVGWIHGKLTGQPWPIAIERAALYANTLLFVFFLLAAVPIVAWRFGSWPAAILAAGPVTVARFSSEYAIGICDHHGIVSSCALLSVLFLLAGGAGWIRRTELRRNQSAWEPDWSQARHWFAASGVAGAAGLWISAATMVPVLIGIGLGSLIATGWLGREKTDQALALPAPELWRWWGAVGAAASFLFYLVEYFPSHLGWRLEVNHPLYSLAWLGAGDVLCRANRWLNRRPFAETPIDGLLALLSAIALAAPAAAIGLWPQHTFLVADPFVWALHVGYIDEFSSQLTILRRSSPTDAALQLIVNVGALHLLWLPAIALLVRRRCPLPGRTLIALSLPAALIASVMAVQQTRWLNLSSALWLAVLVALAHATGKATGAFRWTRPWKTIAAVTLTLSFLPYPIVEAWDIGRALQSHIEAPASTVQQFVARDFAFWLRRRVGRDPAVVMSGPGTTTSLIYYGGFPGVGTLYWENRDGLRSTVDVFGAPTPAEALAALQRRGVTHLVIFPWDPFARFATRLARGAGAGDNPRSFLLDVLERGTALPRWVRPLPYYSPMLEHLRDQWVLALEIVPGQSEEEATVRRAQILAANGSAESAGGMLNGVLDKNPDCLPALVALAQIQSRERESERFRPTVSRVLTLLPADSPLELGDRVALVQVLAVAGENDRARDQLARAWRDATESALRKLAPEELDSLTKLSSALPVNAPRPEQLALCESLLAENRPRAGPPQR
jgi:hypothetical protein